MGRTRSRTRKAACWRRSSWHSDRDMLAPLQSLSLLRGACGGGLLLGFVLIDDAFQARDILQQSLRAQAQEVVAEFRILEVDFEQPVIGDGEHFPLFDAFERLRAAVVW